VLPTTLKYTVIDNAIVAKAANNIDGIILLFRNLNFIFSLEEFIFVFLIFMYKTKATVRNEIRFASISGTHRNTSIVVPNELEPFIS
jgi:hypothetical protein